MQDKTAIARAAEKFISKGQFDLAIAEWEKLVAERKDGYAYNIIGDLYLRKKAKKEAIESFRKAADVYREDGFTLKAIALYKKILNISPAEVSALIALAELNLEKGLIGNAFENFVLAAEAYDKEGAIQKAIEIYQRVIQLIPHNINQRIKMAELYLKVGLRGEAAEQHVAIASSCLSRGETERAEEFYLKAIDIDKQSIQSFIGLSQIAEKEHNTDQAIEYLKKALSIEPHDKNVLKHYSTLLLKKGNLEEAKSTLLNLLKADPFDTEGKRLLSTIYLNEDMTEKAWEGLMPGIDEALAAKKWDEALESLDKFRKLRLTEVKCRIASAYKGRGDKEAAVDILKELAELYEEEEKYNNALQSYKEILKLNAEDETAREKIKWLEEKLGLAVLISPEESPAVEVITALEEAETLQEETKTISSHEFETKKNEADFYARYGFEEQAIKLYENLLRISPDNKEIKKKLQALKPGALTEAMPGEDVSSEKVSLKTSMDSDFEDILQDFRKGVEKEIGEKDVETHYNLGIAYKEMGLLDDAVREFQIAAKDYNKTRQSLIMIAVCYMEKGLYESAINVLQKVIVSMSPADVGYLDAQYDLADAYLRNKEYANALKLFVEIQTQKPAFRDVAQKVNMVKELIRDVKDKPKPRKDRVSYL